MSQSRLARKTLINLGLRVAVVISVMTAITYIHVTNIITAQSLEYLEKYVAERGKYDSMIFKLAEDNHAIIKKEMYRLLKQSDNQSSAQDFDTVFVTFPDGTTRSRLEGYDGSRDPFGFIGKDTVIDSDLKRRAMIFYQLSAQYGQAWHHRLQNLYFTTPENLLVGYWPEVPGWAHELPADFNMPDEEYVAVASKENNPKRETVWTGLFYDVAGKVWMTSVETPVDYNGKHIATIGHDITLNELFSRVVNNRLEGSYNLVFRDDGRLIVHPDKMEQIKKQNSRFEIAQSDDEHLKLIYDIIKRTSNIQGIIDDPELDDYLSVTRYKEPGWLFVNVYPKALVAKAALGTAKLILALGLLSLIIELIIFYWVIKRNISIPMNSFLAGIVDVTKGNMDVKLDPKRDDELGELAETFNTMASTVKERTTELEKSQLNLQHTLDEKAAEAEKNRILFDTSPVGLALADMNGKLLDVNQAYADILGRGIEECYALTYWDVTPEKYSDQEQIQLKSLEVTGRYGPYEKEYIHKDGHLIPVRLSGMILERGGESFIWSSVEDISDIKTAYAELGDSQARLIAMFESIPDAVLMADTNRRITLTNSAVTQVFGYQDDELMGHETSDLYAHPDDFKQTGQNRYNTMAEVNPAPYDVEYRRKDGTTFWGETMGTKIRSEDGEVYGYVGIIRDVTERKAIEAELAKHRDELEGLVNERTNALHAAQSELLKKERLATLGQLTATVSHELRNPLGAIQPSLYLIQKYLKTEDEKVINALARIRRNVERCDRIVDELLDFTRVNELARTGRDLDAWLTELIHEYDLPAPIEFVLNCNLDGAVAQMDAGQMQRALINVLNNAVQAIQQDDYCDAPRIEINTSQEEGNVIMIISDNGVGISSDLLPRIFEPLYSTKTFGVGLGMAVVRKVMESHGGDVVIESKEGKGTSVKLWFPLVYDSKDKKEVAA